MKSAFIIAGILAVLLASIFIGWKFFGKGEIISATGSIKYIPLEGGFYGIETDKGEKYLPLNLPAEFKKDGLKVWFKAKPKKSAAIQMWGKPVEILEIKKIQECQTDADCTFLNCPNPYCDNGKCKCPSQNISEIKRPEKEKEEAPNINTSKEEQEETVKSLLGEIENITKELEEIGK